jgi:hypothetical protein
LAVVKRGATESAVGCGIGIGIGIGYLILIAPQISPIKTH